MPTLGIWEHLEKHGLPELNIRNLILHPYEHMALNFGHLELFLVLFKVIRPKNHHREIHKFVCIYRLTEKKGQRNRIDLYKKYTQLTKSYAPCRIIMKTIKINDILTISTTFFLMM